MTRLLETGPARLARRAHAAGVHFAYALRYADPDHVWLASYPRSGNTWLRRLLLGAMAGHDDDAGIRHAVPDLNQGVRRLRHMRGPFVKTHYPRHTAYRRVAYLVRDPIDCLASYWAYEGKRTPRRRRSAEAFVAREIAGRGPYGSWAAHVESYLGAPASGDAPAPLVVRYEDMLRDPVIVLGRVLTLAGMDADPVRLRAVCDAEAARFAGGAAAPETSARRQVGKGTRTLPPDLVERILASPIGAVAERLGYGSTGRRRAAA